MAPTKGRQHAGSRSGQKQADAGSDRPIRLTLLGDFRVERQGVLVPPEAWKGRKSRTLVKLLALEQPHRRHKEEIQDILWPDLDAASAAAAFRKALHYARKVLNGDDMPPCLRLSRGIVSLDAALTWIDVDAFEAAARAALHSPDGDLFTQAIRLWTGELLPEDIYEDWSVTSREALRKLYVQLLTEGARSAEQRDQYPLAIELLAKALDIYPAAEDLHRQVMRLFALNGDAGKALAQYELCRQSLARDVDADPDTETVSLYEEIRVELDSTSPSRALPEHRNLVLPPPPLPDAIVRTPTDGFVGRNRPLQLLLGGWRPALAAVRPRAIAVIGEAGVGKSRLVAEAARQIHAAGGSVLWGACYEHEGELAYGPFVDALETYLQSLSDADLAAVGGVYPELGDLLPALGRLASHRPASGVDRARLFDAVARLLTQLADSRRGHGEPTPLLIVVDDIQNADVATRALFHYLARLDGDQPWLLVCTLREEVLTSENPARSLISNLVRAGRCHEVELLRLSENECRMLVGFSLAGTMEEDLVALVYRHSLGNPLFTQQILGALVERGQVVGDEDGWRLSTPVTRRAEDNAMEATESIPGGLPAQIMSVVTPRLARLDNTGKLIVETAAVIGRRFSFDLLDSAVTSLVGRKTSRIEMLDAVDDLLGLKLIQESGDGYEFSHPLLATAVHDTLSKPRRVALHGAVAAVLETQSPEMVEALSHHFKQAGNRDREAYYLELAADRAAATFANELAVSRYREVLRLLAPDLDKYAVRVARAKATLAHVLMRLGQYEEPVELLSSAVDTLERGGEEDAYLKALAELARALRGTGRLAEAFARLDGVLHGQRGSEPELEAPWGRPNGSSREPGRGEALLRLVYAELLVSRGDYDSAGWWATEARECARESGDMALVAEAELLRSTTVSLLHSVEEGRRVAEAALPMVLDHAGLETLDRALQALSFSHKSLGNFAEMYRYTEESLDTARRIGDRGQIALHTARLGQASLLSGKLGRAQALVEEASALLDQVTSVAITSNVMLYRGQVETLSGDWDAAHQTLKTVTALYFDQGGPVDTARMAAYWLSEIALWEGRPAEAVRHLEGILPPAPSREVPRDLDEYLIMSQMAVASSELTRLGCTKDPLIDPGAVSEASVEHLRMGRAMMYLPSPLRAQGIVLFNQGHCPEGQAKIREALELNRAIGYRWGEITDLRALAKVQRLAQMEEEADLSLAQCVGIALELGAPRLVPHLEQSVGASRSAG